MRIELPWPDKKLSPNARVHFHALAKAKKEYKQLVTWEFNMQISHIPDFLDGNIPIKITFHPPDRRRRDDDNAITSFKAGRDAIAQALGVDDFRFRPVTYDWQDPVKGGKVVVVVG